MSLVYWDSMLFMYALERNPVHAPVVERVLDAMERRGDTLCTSIFSVAEILVGPRKLGSTSGAEQVKRFFAGGTVVVLPFDLDTVEQFASIRAWTSVRPPDAIHLASASVAQVDLFLTNDRQLARLQIPGITRIASLEPESLFKLLS